MRRSHFVGPVSRLAASCGIARRTVSWDLPRGVGADDEVSRAEGRAARLSGAGENVPRSAHVQSAGARPPTFADLFTPCPFFPRELTMPTDS